MPDTTKTKFSTTIIAITGLISAIGGVITILHNVGAFGGIKTQPEEVKIEKKAPIEQELIQEQKAKKVVEPVEFKEEKKSNNLTGYWFPTNNGNGKYYINHKASGVVDFTEYSLVYGEWIATASGIGNCINDIVQIPYTTYIGTSGKFEGKVLADGKEIQGSINDFNAGMKALLYLKKEE